MISVPQLLIILAIILVLFGAKRLRNIGSDLGGAIKSFRQSVKDGEAGEETKTETTAHADKNSGGRIIEAETVVKDKEKV
jgi:sec-independent protein translocase protein TatA